MANYFWTADPHFQHNMIRIYCNRPFDDIDEHDETIIENWNKTVGVNDFIYVLGDFGWGDCRTIFNRLRGRKYLIRGNHDRNPTLKFPWAWVKDTAMIEVRGHYIWLSHYARRSWNRSFHGSWHLFGHTHGRLGPYGKSLDVGVDAWNFAPVSFDTLQAVFARVGENME
jgi:calcineurin-like phosphoesterase family protein